MSLKPYCNTHQVYLSVGSKKKLHFLSNMCGIQHGVYSNNSTVRTKSLRGGRGRGRGVFNNCFLLAKWLIHLIWVLYFHAIFKNVKFIHCLL